MARDTLLLVFTCVTFIGYSQQLRAQKCFKKPFFSTEHCERDLRPLRCEEGVISIQLVKHENDNCNLGCRSTCCQEIDGSTSEDVRQKVYQECNHKETCSLKSITYGTAIVEYMCIDISSTSSTSVSSSTVATSTSTSSTSVSSSTVATSTPTTTHNSSTWMTNTSSTSHTTGSSIEGSCTTSSFNSSAHDQNHVHVDKENGLQTAILIAIVVVVAVCVATIPVAIICCRRYKKNRQQRVSNKLELDVSSGISHADDRENTGPLDSPTDNAPPRYRHQAPETGNMYNTTTEVLDRAKAANTDNEYDHLDHRKGRLTGNNAFEGASANSCNAAYDTALHTGANVVVWSSPSNTDNVYNTANHSGKTLVDDKSGNNTENVYDTTNTTDNIQMVVENYNVYDITTPSGGTMVPEKKANTTENVYDTTRQTGNHRKCRMKEYPNRSGETIEAEYDVCNTSAVDMSTQLAETYDTMSTNHTVPENATVYGNRFDDTYANLS